MVAAFELTDRKVVNPESKGSLERKVDLKSEGTLNQDEHHLAYVNCPYCEASIQFSKAIRGGGGGVKLQQRLTLRGTLQQG